jgi:DNA-binding NarL/FixJ family response regulator
MLTVYDDDARIFDAICAGACGYLLKNTPPARLLESLNNEMAGGSLMSAEVARRVIELFREIHPPGTCRLSPHAVRIPPPSIAGGWAQLQDRRRGSRTGRPVGQPIMAAAAFTWRSSGSASRTYSCK